MRYHVLLTSLCFLPIALAGCDRTAAGEDGAALVLDVQDSAGVRVVALRDPAAAGLPQWAVDAAPIITVGGAATTDPAHDLHVVVGAARLADGGVAVANFGSSEIRLFDAAGRHARTLGRAGDGPGEFTGLAWIAAAADTIIAFDSRQRRVTWFAPDGAVANTLPLAAAGAGGFPDAVGMVDGSFIARAGFDRRFGRGERRDTLVLYRFADDGSLADSLARYPGTERYFHQTPDVAMQFPPIFGRDAFVHAAAGRIAVGATDEYAVDVYDHARLALRVRADVPTARPAAGQVERERERLGGGASGSLPAPIAEARRQAVAAIPARETLPAFGALRVDRAGAVWIRDYHVADGRPQQWTVLDSDGTPRARVALPAPFDVFDIGHDYVVGRARDADDVETVLVLRLTRR